MCNISKSPGVGFAGWLFCLCRIFFAHFPSVLASISILNWEDCRNEQIDVCVQHCTHAYFCFLLAWSSCLVDLVFLRAACWKERSCYAKSLKSDFSLGWEIAYYLFECVIGASFGLLSSGHPCAVNTETWVYMITNKLPVIQHLLVLSLVWIEVEKFIKCKIWKWEHCFFREQERAIYSCIESHG